MIKGESSEQCSVAGFEDGGTGPRTKDCGQPLEAGKGKRSIPSRIREGEQPSHHLDETHWVWSSDLQNCKTIHLCGFKPQGLW